MDGTDKDGNQSVATIKTVNRFIDRSDTITANGETFVNLSSGVKIEDGKPKFDGSPVAFELGSDKLTV